MKVYESYLSESFMNHIMTGLFRLPLEEKQENHEEKQISWENIDCSTEQKHFFYID